MQEVLVLIKQELNTILHAMGVISLPVYCQIVGGPLLILIQRCGPGDVGGDDLQSIAAVQYLCA